MARPKVAFFEFTSCEGCQPPVVDSLQPAPGLLEAVEIVRFREAMSEKGEGYAVAFVEGACSRPGDEAALKEIREKAQLVVALGACAHLGGVNTHPQPPHASEPRAGCDAICPTYGDGCEGCRGLIPSPNLDSLKQVLAEHHLSPDETLAKLTLFLTYQTMAMEAAGDGTAKR